MLILELLYNLYTIFFAYLSFNQPRRQRPAAARTIARHCVMSHYDSNLIFSFEFKLKKIDFEFKKIGFKKIASIISRVSIST